MTATVTRTVKQIDTEQLAAVVGAGRQGTLHAVINQHFAKDERRVHRQGMGRPRRGFDIQDVAVLAVFQALRTAGLPIASAIVMARRTAWPVRAVLERLPGVAEFPGFALTEAERETVIADLSGGLADSRFCFFPLPEPPAGDALSHAYFVDDLADLPPTPAGILINFTSLAEEVAGRLAGPLVSYIIDQPEGEK